MPRRLRASALGAPLGIVTCFMGAVVFGVVLARDRHAGADVIRTISWSVLALVAGLFVLVQGVEQTEFLRLTRTAVKAAATWPAGFGVLAAGALTALVTNAVNNLPAGLIAGSSLTSLHGHDALRSAVAIGIDLGPNLSVIGSLRRFCSSAFTLIDGSYVAIVTSPVIAGLPKAENRHSRRGRYGIAGSFYTRQFAFARRNAGDRITYLRG